jgi:hypothetical protein
MPYQRWTDPVHPIATERLRAWRSGDAFPCYRCGVGDSMSVGHECANCVAPQDAHVIDHRQLDIFGGIE